MQTEEDKLKNPGSEAGAPAPTASPSSASNQAPAPEAPKTIEVPVDTLQEMMAKLEALQEKDRERDEEMEILRDSVSRGALEEAENKHKKKSPPRAHLMVHNGKIVTGWKMEDNELIYDPRNLAVPVNEKLTIKVKYSDGGESDLMPYVNFVRNKDRARVTKTGENGIMWIVTFDDPSYGTEPLEVDPQFLNP